MELTIIIILSIFLVVFISTTVYLLAKEGKKYAEVVYGDKEDGKLEIVDPYTVSGKEN